ncbi:hypothetical protein C8J57DRAFT_1245797 [Mycena rebaudengoi]|nr:hypothetical protein C8J57DRAFT_1245797 [Mycena rebaudengoi]
MSRSPSIPFDGILSAVEGSRGLWSAYGEKDSYIKQSQFRGLASKEGLGGNHPDTEVLDRTLGKYLQHLRNVSCELEGLASSGWARGVGEAEEETTSTKSDQIPAYATPNPETQYSAEYFAALTIFDAHQIIQNNCLPAILPKGSIQNWCWSDTVPTAATDIIVTAADTVPCLEDLLPITQAAEDAFNENARSICIRIKGKTQRYHFSKIRLIVNINNHAYNLQAVSCILDRVVSSFLLLPGVREGHGYESTRRVFGSGRPGYGWTWLPAINGFGHRDPINSDNPWTTRGPAEFKLCKFSEPLAGFCIARATPIYMLGCLLDEQWVIEDILNARAELTYFRQAAKDLGPVLSFLFLPTFFINTCRKLYALPHRPYSPNLVELRERIRKGDVLTLGFVSYLEDHYSAVHLLVFEGLEYDDSLHLTVAPDLVPILRWAFAGLPGHPKTGLVGKQSIAAGGGSCGIAATNFIECCADIGAPRWRARQSAQFRDEMLRDLILYHTIARKTTTPYSHWVEPCPRIPIGEVAVFIEDEIGYLDFNLDNLSWNDLKTQFEHPIFDWVSNPDIPINLSAHSAVKSPPTVPSDPQELPKSLAISARPLASNSFVSRLLGPAFELQGPVPPISRLTHLNLDSFVYPEVFGTSSDSVIVIPDSPAPRPILTSTTPIIIPDSPPPPKTPPRAIKQEILDLCSPDTPPRLATKEEIQELQMSPFRPAVKRKNSSAAKVEPIVINLVSPPQKLKTESRGNGNRVPRQQAPMQPTRQIQVAFGPIKVGNIYNTIEDTTSAVYQCQEALGHKWIIGQSYSDDGVLKKRTLRCNRSRRPKETHRMDIDPSDHRQGRSGRTDCQARVNITRMSGHLQQWHITLVDGTHNYDRSIPEGGQAQRLPTAAQREVAGRFTDFSRKQLAQGRVLRMAGMLSKRGKTQSRMRGHYAVTSKLRAMCTAFAIDPAARVRKNLLGEMRLASRKQRPGQLETLFKHIIDLLRQHVGPFALQTCVNQMKLSMFYDTDALQLPDGIRNWSEYAIALNDAEPSYIWQNGEEQQPRNDFANDNAYIGTRFLLRLIRERACTLPSSQNHSQDGRYMCDCCMPSNLGVVCRHYFVGWTKISGLPFHVSLIRARWYQGPALDVRETPAVTLNGHSNHKIRFSALSLPAASIANPVFTIQSDTQNGTPSPSTRTIPQRTVYNTLLSETQEQLDEARDRLVEVGLNSNFLQMNSYFALLRLPLLVFTLERLHGIT